MASAYFVFKLNNKRSFKLVEPDDTAIVRIDGMVLLIIKNIVEGHCNFNYYTFPFDIQECTIHFALSRYYWDSNDVILSGELYTYEFQNFPNDEWQMLIIAPFLTILHLVRII